MRGSNGGLNKSKINPHPAGDSRSKSYKEYISGPGGVKTESAAGRRKRGRRPIWPL
jgi:hypothetical protein